jgi:sulfur oxidation c-type cytochrome SoxX
VSRGLRLGFALACLGLAVTVAWAFVREYRSEWRSAQARFRALGGAGSSGEEGGGLHQIWVRDLDRVDRCTSCHLGIDGPENTSLPQPFRSHPGRWLQTHPMARYGCTVCHGGQGEATTWRGAAHRPIPHWPEPILSPELMQGRCGSCHREPVPPRAYWLARGRAIMVDRNCAACHEGTGLDPSLVRAPRLSDLGLKVSPAWLRAWLRSPRAWLPRSRMGDFRLSAREVEALTSFLLQPRGEVVLDRVDFRGASVERGGEVFRRARCVTCHEVDGRGGTLGPSLTHVGAKASREWLYSWIRDPQRLQPDTMMPRFRFKDEEVRDLAAYLAEEYGAAPAGFVANDRAPDPALAREGRKVFEKRGCYSCHELRGFAPLARIGPTLAGVGERAFEARPLAAAGTLATVANWLFAKLKAPERILETARMPTFGLSDADAAAVTVALLSLRRGELPAGRMTGVPAPARYQPQGEFGRLVRRYRCLSCHSIGGTGGTLSTVPLDRIGSQLTRAHLERYIASPWGVRVGLPERMPHLNVAPGEARLLADYLSKVMVDDSLQAELPSGAALVERGRERFQSLGCVACHIVGGRGGYVGPELNGSGARLKPGWTVAWLRTPERWKPGTLQPDYGLERRDAEALAAYVLSLPARRAKTGSE